jgi:CheY-like chemotaxis protein
MQKRKRFGEILVEAKVLSEETLAKALEQQRRTKRRLGQVLEELGVVTERDIAAALARQFGFKTVSNIARASFSPELLGLLGPEAAMSKLVFPLKAEAGVLHLAMVNPLDMDVIDSITFQSGLRVTPCVTTPSEIQAAIKAHYYLPPGKGGRGGHRWTILVIDNQDSVRSTVVTALSQQGFELLEADQVADGLRLALQKHPHLIVTDTVLPRMDGDELFRVLQGNDQTKKIPIIALSSKASVEEEARLLDLGFHDFIHKPVKPLRLVARVNRLLRLIYSETPSPP